MPKKPEEDALYVDAYAVGVIEAKLVGSTLTRDGSGSPLILPLCLV